jgi:hypothetical protein
VAPLIGADQIDRGHEPNHAAGNPEIGKLHSCVSGEQEIRRGDEDGWDGNDEKCAIHGYGRNVADVTSVSHTVTAVICGALRTPRKACFMPRAASS